MAQSEAENKHNGSGSLKWIAIAGVFVLLIALGYAIFMRNRVYTAYDVNYTRVRSDGGSAEYFIMDDGIVRYSKDGVSFSDRSGNILWSQTFELATPSAATSGMYFAIGDVDGNSLYIFNKSGQCGHLTTSVPIQKLEISDQGVVGVILSDSSSNFVNLYDRQGTELISIRATLDNTGYPVSFGLSPDAAHMAVSYLDISKGSVNSKLIFYDFGSADTEPVIGEEEISGIIPRIVFLDNTRAAVFSETGFRLYGVSGESSLIEEVTFEDDIKSIFSANSKIGFVLKNQDEKGKNRIELYDREGKKNMTAYTNIDYSEVFADSEEILLYNDSRAMVYNYNGGLTFDGVLDFQIQDMMPSWENGTYLVISSQIIREIRVK